MKTYDEFWIRDNGECGSQYVPAEVAQRLYDALDAAKNGIQELADEYGAIPDYLDDITGQLAAALAAADGEEV